MVKETEVVDVPPNEKNEKDKVESNSEIETKEEEKTSWKRIFFVLFNSAHMLINIFCLVWDGAKLPESDILIDKESQWYHAWVCNVSFIFGTLLPHIVLLYSFLSKTYPKCCSKYFGYKCQLILVVFWGLSTFFLTGNLFYWAYMYLSSPWDLKFKSIALFSEVLFFINFIPFICMLVYQGMYPKRFGNCPVNQNTNALENQHTNSPEGENTNTQSLAKLKTI
jgi:hypothetical protein